MLARRNMLTDIMNPFRSSFFEPFGVQYDDFGLIEKEDRYILKVEVPGFTEKDIKIEIKEGYLTVNGRCEHKEGTDGDVFSSTKVVKQTVWLPSDTDTETIGAELKSGILAVSIPKREKKEIKGKEVPVKMLK